MYNKNTDRAVILRPTMLVEEITSFLKSFKKLNISGLSAGAMGTDLNSDFNESEKLQSNRADTKEQILKGVQSIKNDGLKFMTDGCNEYMLKYTDIIANAPMSNSGYFVCDEVVPFYQMVLHGYGPYISTPLNQADDEQIAFLQAVEMGAGLSYIWMYAENLTLKDITFDIGYSLNYKQWYDSAIEYYNKANSQLKGLSTQLMVDHYRAIDNQDVFVTVYEDGTKVIVNYTDAQVTVENTTVMAKDFAVVRG